MNFIDNNSNNILSIKASVPQTFILRVQSDGDEEMLRFESNGDIYVKGRLVENDKEVVEGFREFLRGKK